MLSGKLREQLKRLAALLEPQAAGLERRFRHRLKQLGIGQREGKALSSITPGAIAKLLAGGAGMPRMFEEIEYHGRRLAKLNLRPDEILHGLQEYNRFLTPAVRALAASEEADFRWVREQLHFCVVLILNNAYYQVREGESQTFYELARRELEAQSLEDLLQGALSAMARYAGAPVGHLFLLNDAGSAWVLRASTKGGFPIVASPQSVPNTRKLRSRLGRPRYLLLDDDTEPGLLLDEEWARKFRAVWSVPLASAGRLAGVIQFGFPTAYEWMPREQELLASAAERCLRAAEKAKLLEDLAAHKVQIRRLAERMLQVEEAERRRISRELHDEAGQSLLCVRLQLEMLEAATPEGMPDHKSRLREIRKLTEHSILEIRRLIAALSPAVLEQIGLAAALRQLSTRLRAVLPCRVRLQLGKLSGLPKEIEIIVYRLVQECFNNIAKHSFASNVNVSAHLVDGILRLHVEDDGIGFDVEQAAGRGGTFGLSGIRERVAVLGGTCSVKSQSASTGEGAKPGRTGTILRIELPVTGLREAAAPETQKLRSDSGRKRASEIEARVS